MTKKQIRINENKIHLINKVSRLKEEVIFFKSELENTEDSYRIKMLNEMIKDRENDLKGLENE